MLKVGEEHEIPEFPFPDGGDLQDPISLKCGSSLHWVSVVLSISEGVELADL